MRKEESGAIEQLAAQTVFSFLTVKRVNEVVENIEITEMILDAAVMCQESPWKIVGSLFPEKLEAYMRRCVDEQEHSG